MVKDLSLTQILTLTKKIRPNTGEVEENRKREKKIKAQDLSISV